MYYTKNDIVKALKKAGVKKNDTVFFTTSLGMLGKPKTKGLLSAEKISKFMLEAIKNTLGPKGTILIPTYSYSFGKFQRNKLPSFPPVRNILKKLIFSP